MKRQNWLVLIPAALFAGSLMAGCELEEDTTCTTDSDCPEGETCEIPAGDEEGTCGGGGGGGTACSATNPCSNGWACDIAAGATDGLCATACTATTGCADGFTCNAGGTACEATTYTWPWIAVVSTTTNTDDLNNNTPGPDIDAVELGHGGGSFWATTVQHFVAGAVGSDGNVNADPNNLTGANDAIPTGGGECDLGEDPDGLFYSMGSGSASMTPIGFAIVSFANPPVDTDTITIWELSSSTCDNVSRERQDGYEVFIGRNDADPMDIASANDLRGNADQWLSLGSSEGNGGKTTFSVDLP